MLTQGQTTALSALAKVLIVDDDATNVAILQGILESIGYQVTIGHDGHEALALIEQEPPDLILLDVIMPELDGFEVCRRVKSTPRWQDIPIIIITGLDETEDYMRALDCGADDFMTKPFTVAVLLARVRGYLRASQAMAELRESEERYRGLVELSPDAILVSCTDKIVFLNTAGARLLGATTPDEILGLPLQQFIHPDSQDRVAACLHTMQQNRTTTPLLEERCVRLDGSTVNVEMTALPITYQNTLAELVVVRDITERIQVWDALRAAKDAAEEASVAKSQFLANMSHELRTPLNAIIGYSEMLQEEAEDLGQEDFLPDLGKIRTAGKHLLALINDILDLSKIEAGKMTFYVESFDVQGMIRDVVTTVEPLVKKNGNTLQVDQAADCGMMHSDLTRIKQSVLNLLSNACKFTDQGTVTLTVHRETVQEQDWLCFQVRDTGIGMSSEQCDRLFQAFTQADASTTRKYGGTGLGLVITQRFCQMLGGDITVHSVLGEGSTFTIHLPAMMHAPTPKTQTDTPAETASPDSSNTPSTQAILVIDDDPSARELLSRTLTREGFRVVTAATGEEGLRLARLIRPAAITLDILLPGINGWDVLTALRADPDLTGIPIIMLTITDDQEKGFALGATEFLTKPIDGARLSTVLQRYSQNNTPNLALVVEDDDGLRELMRRQLHKAGWDVTEAENGLVALHRLEHIQPSVILLDLMMPEMDGFMFINELHKHDAWRAIPVVVVSAKELTIEEQRQLDQAVTTVLQKGEYTCEDLLQQLHHLVLDCLPEALPS